MKPERKNKKYSASFSLTDKEVEEIMERAEYLGFKDRSEYLLALLAL
jgi:hypothetical protein